MRTALAVSLALSLGAAATASAQPALPTPLGGPAPEGDLRAARQLLERRSYDEAERLARRLLVRATEPGLVAASWSVAGLAAGARGDCDGALPALRRALRAPTLVRDDLPRLELTLARCLRAQGRLTPARRHAEAALGHLQDPELRAEAYELVAAGALARGEEARAAQALARAWPSAPPVRRAALRELAGKLGTVNPADLRLAFETLRPDRFPAAELALKLAEFAHQKGLPDEGRAVLAAAAVALREDPALQAAAEALRERLAGRVAVPIADPSSRADAVAAPSGTAAAAAPGSQPGPAASQPDAAGSVAPSSGGALWPTTPPPLPAGPLPAAAAVDPGATFPPEPPPPASSAAASPGLGASPVLPERRKIALLVPLSGAGKDVGERVLRGARLALASRETALAEGLDLLPLDTRGDAATAASLAAEAARDPAVLALVGPVLVREAAAAAEAAARAQLPLLALSQAEGLTAAGPSTFRLFLTAERQARGVAVHAVQKLGRRRFAILHPPSPYGQALRAAFTAEVQRLGATVVTALPYERGPHGFRDAARALRGQPFDALFFPDGFRSVALGASYLVTAGVRIGDAGAEGVALLGTNEWNSDELLRLGGRYLQHAVFPVGFSAQSPRSEAQRFLAAHQAAHGGSPTFLEAYAYDALRALRLCAARGAVTREALPAALASVDLDGATGPVRFDARREPAAPPLLLQVEGGALRPVE